MPKVQALKLSGLLLFTPDRHGDARGWFSESWRKDFWRSAGIDFDFVQDNESYSCERGTIRGLHFQAEPAEQAKLVRVLRGRILDVAVDIRIGSPDYGKHVSVELSAENAQQLLIPAGFAHGFCTLEPDTYVAYKVSDYYSSAYEGGIRWNDPDLAIAWPVDESNAHVSDKDRGLPFFEDVSR